MPGVLPDLKARLEAERSGRPFLVFTDGDGRQQLFSFEPGMTEASIGRERRQHAAAQYDLLNGHGDVRSQVRHNCYAGVAAAITALGVQAHVLEGKIPNGAKDVMGIMAGAESFDVAGATLKSYPVQSASI